MGVIFFRAFFSLALFFAGDPESQRWHGTLAAELASRPRYQARACPLLTINVLFDRVAFCSQPGLSWLRNGQWKEWSRSVLAFSCVEIES